MKPESKAVNTHRYGLRPRTNTTQTSAPSKVEKRASKPGGGHSIEPQAKRATVGDASTDLPNVSLDTSNEPAIANQPAPQNENEEPMEVEEEPMEVDEPQAPMPFDPCMGYNFDAECGNNVIQVGEYAEEIFAYLRSRMSHFKVTCYLKSQPNIKKFMRAKLVNWMVTVQSQFKLNHETLYLAVKIVDIYLARSTEAIVRDKLQLLGVTAIFMAVKFDVAFQERILILIDDLLYMCEDQYVKSQAFALEYKVFETLGFELGVPLSYRFLRRFSRVILNDMTTLTLARYILETSLIFYEFVQVKDDIMAAASLLLALRMRGLHWDPRLTKYTTYTEEQVLPLMWQLNHMMHMRSIWYTSCDAANEKYLTELFFNVADIPLLPNRFKFHNGLIIPPNAINN